MNHMPDLLYDSLLLTITHHLIILRNLSDYLCGVSNNDLIAILLLLNQPIMTFSPPYLSHLAKPLAKITHLEASR